MSSAPKSLSVGGGGGGIIQRCRLINVGTLAKYNVSTYQRERGDLKYSPSPSPASLARPSQPPVGSPELASAWTQLLQHITPHHSRTDSEGGEDVVTQHHTTPQLSKHLTSPHLRMAKKRTGCNVRIRSSCVREFLAETIGKRVVL